MPKYLILALMLSAPAFAGDLELAPGTIIQIPETVKFQRIQGQGSRGWHGVDFIDGRQYQLTLEEEGQTNYCSLGIYARESNPDIRGRSFVAHAHTQPLNSERHSYEILEFQGTSASGKPVSIDLNCYNPPPKDATIIEYNLKYSEINKHIGGQLKIVKLVLEDPKRPGSAHEVSLTEATNTEAQDVTADATR